MACAEHGHDKIENMVKATDNGTCLDWFKHPELLIKDTKDANMIASKNDNSALEATPAFNQLKVLLRRGYIKAKRDSVSICFIFPFMSKLVLIRSLIFVLF